MTRKRSTRKRSTRKRSGQPDAADRAPRPGGVDRLIVQQYDTGHTVTIGGIDTCLRGLLEYAPPGVEIGDRRGGRGLGTGARARPMGEPSAWGEASSGSCRSPGSTPAGAGGSSRTRCGSSRVCCATGPRSPCAGRAGAPAGRRLAVRLLFRAPLVYCIHTQERGLLGRTSDSFWRFAGGASTSGWTGDGAAGAVRHRLQPGLRRAGAAVEPAHRVRPHLVRPGEHPVPARDRRTRTRSSGWAGSRCRRTRSWRSGRSPHLAARRSRGALEPPGRRLRLAAACRSRRRSPTLPPDVAGRITLRGRLAPAELAEVRSRSGVLPDDLPPRLRGLSAGAGGGAGQPGCPAVVTEGSDTGGLVRPRCRAPCTAATPRSWPTACARHGPSTGARSPRWWPH